MKTDKYNIQHWCRIKQCAVDAAPARRYAGKKLLFIGTGCQTDGFRAFAEKRRISENIGFMAVVLFVGGLFIIRSKAIKARLNV